MHTPERDLPKDLHELIESLAENTYNINARQRLAGSKSAAARSATAFPPYEELPDVEKQDHRNTAIETLKLILNRGFKLEPPKLGSPGDEGKGPKAAETATLALVAAVNLPNAIALWLAHDPEEWAQTPEIYRRLGRRVLKLGEPLLAYDILTEGLKNQPADVEMRQQVALALARSGATQRSNAILTQLRAEGHRDEETLAILARTHKDLWTRATLKSERARQLKLAHKFYNESYKLNRGYYSGINAATLALLTGKKDEARALAQKVREACLAELKTLPKNSDYRYWPLATLGEACLILRRFSEAEDWYAQASPFGFLDEAPEILHRPEIGIDVAIIGDVVAVIAAGRGIERQQPDRVDPEILDVIQLLDDAAEIADAVVVAVEKGADVQLVDDRVFVPVRVHGHRK